MANQGVKTPNVQGLDLFYAMYAVGLAFGIQEIAAALYKYVSRFLAASTPPVTASDLAVNVALFLAILLLITRFFWSTGNIKRAWERVEEKHSKLAPFFVVFHLPALLIQGALVLFVCFAYAERIAPGVTSGGVLHWFVAATAWNAAWLLILTRGQGYTPESLWIRNNIGFVLIGSGLIYALHTNTMADFITVALFATVSLASSLFDLHKTADQYLTNVGR